MVRENKNLKNYQLPALDDSVYYASFLALRLDNQGRVLDFNMTAEVLMGFTISEWRFQDFRKIIREHPTLILGDVLSLSQEISKKIAGNDSTLKTSDYRVSLSSNYRLNSKDFGWTDVTPAAIPYFDPLTGDSMGITLYGKILRIDREADFYQALDNERKHRLTWEEYALSYDNVLPQLPFYKQAIARHLKTMFSLGKNDILDLGAGTGNVTIPLVDAGYRVTAVDFSRAMLNKLRAKTLDKDTKNLKIIEQDAQHLPQLENESFDGVTIQLALFDIPQPTLALEEAMRVLRPGGVMIITEPKRCFKLQVLFERAEQYLKSIGSYNRLRHDLDRVFRSSKKLDPASRPCLHIEEIAERLRKTEFKEIEMKDSHYGNCATVSGWKGFKPKLNRKNQPTQPLRFRRTRARSVC